MKFIRKNILTAVFFSVFAILLGGALISCSNGSSSSDEDDDESSYGTKIYSESVTFSETPTQIVSAEMLADLSIKSLTIKVINVNYSGSDVWWFTAIPGSDAWNNEAKLKWQSGEDAKSLYLATITDAAAIATYKANGIYIAGTDSATAAVSVFYVEGEAEESNASSGSSSQTENSGNSSSENENNGNSDGNTSSGNENNDSSSEEESTYGKKIYSNSVTFNAETPAQILSAETLADLSIKSLTIKVINVNYSGSDDWWFTACSDSSWKNEAKLEWQSGEGTNSLYLATITDATAIAAYKANGIYIAGTNGATGTVTVSYE